MRMKNLLMAMFFLLLAVGQNIALAIDSGKGYIEGKVISKTIGKAVPDQEVTLYKYLNRKEVGKESTKTDEEGKFRFENLLTQPDYAYGLYAKYQEAEYWSAAITFKGKTAVEDALLTVYESTSNAENIKVKLHHIIFDIQGQFLLVKEIILFYNEGERTYIGEKREGEDKRITLSFSLPEGFSNPEYLQGLMSCCIVPSEQGFLDTMAVKPGPRELVFTYQLRYDSKKYLFRKPVNYDTASLDVLVPAVGVKASSQILSPVPNPMELKGKKYLYLKTQETIKAGTPLTLELSNLPAGQGFFKIIAYSLVAILILLGFAYPFFRKGKVDKSDKGKVKDDKGKVKDSKEALLAAIAQLDDQFQAGKISEKDYRNLRKEKKERLMKLYKTSSTK